MANILTKCMGCGRPGIRVRMGIATLEEEVIEAMCDGMLVFIGLFAVFFLFLFITLDTYLGITETGKAIKKERGL